MAFAGISPSEGTASLTVTEAPNPAPATLDALPVGAVADLRPPDALTPTVLRLMEMGLTPGTRVTVTRRAPGGDPIEIRVRGTRLCLRHADAARFPVRVAPDAGSETRKLP
jgi:Fe2+ transport system protein FeoA